jgi:hypothetical protein
MSDYNYAPLKRFSFVTLTIISLFGYGYFAFATPNIPVTPVGGYNPGTELDPVCPPNQLLPEPCIVKTPSGSSYLAGTGLTLTGSTFSLTPVGTAGTYGSASSVPVITTNASGQVVSVTNTPISLSSSQITPGTNGQVLTTVGGVTTWTTPGVGGTVTSVGLSLPSIFSVSGSPVTTTGTLAATLATQSANTIFAGPTTGGAATPTFRTLVVADLPTNIPNTNLANSSVTINAGTGLTGGGTVSLGGTLSPSLGLPNTGTAGTYGSATQVPVFTTDAQGRVTSVTNTTITPAASSLTGTANVTAGSTKVTLAGTPTGAVLKAFSVDVNEANLALQNIGGALSVTQQNAINFSNLSGNVNLTSQVTGILPVANGGTGQSSLTLGSLLVGNGTSPVTLLGAGTNGQVLTIVSGAPAWAAAGSFSGWSLTGNAGTTAGTNFIGTTDAQDFVIKANSLEVARFYNDTIPATMHSVALGGGVAPSPYMFVYGDGAGTAATNAGTSNFFGYHSGQNATNASDSNFFGTNTGDGATDASASNFFGPNAGQGATSAYFSNFIGASTGQNATGAHYSNFIGVGAGQDASTASQSNFIGYAAGNNATNALQSTFIGTITGQDATNASFSVFIGSNAGSKAINSNDSIFLGSNAGRSDGGGVGLGSIKANNSIFIGKNAGFNGGDLTLDNSTGGKTSILIGEDTSTGGFSDSIALGKGATNTATNQFMIGSIVKPIDTTRFQGAVLGTQCTITTGTGIACTSDERLKKNIVDIPANTLDVLMNIRTVHYNLIGDTSARNQIGFLAQNLEQYFPELVDTNSDGYKSVYYAQMTPILTEAVKELNLRLISLESIAASTSFRTTLLSVIKDWLADAGNGIESIFTRKVTTQELCVGSRCVTEDQFNQLLDQAGISNSSGATIQPVTNNSSEGDNGGSSTTNDTTIESSSSDTTQDSSDTSQDSSEESSTPVVDTSGSSSNDTVTSENTPITDNVSPTETTTP